MGDIKAVIIVGGPSRGTRFRPLSLDVPKVSCHILVPEPSVVLMDGNCSPFFRLLDIPLFSII